jgi:hypothetical protein
VAGDVNRVKKKEYEGKMMRAAKSAGSPGPQFREDSFFEYHIYTSGGDRWTIRPSSSAWSLPVIP